MYNRRDFLKISGATATALGTTSNCFCSIAEGANKVSSDSTAASELMENLLKDWCDGMLKMQVHRPNDPAIHGALACPACSIIHGRCMDAVYPFFYMADRTGQQKYLDAGIDVFEWSKNVTLPDGSWTVVTNPKSWRGITVFGAIALAEALKYHENLLDKSRRDRWLARLRQAGEFIYNYFPDINKTNINYGCTMVYAMHLLGEFLNVPKYIAHSHKLAGQFPKFLTKPNLIIFGEGKPYNKKSEKGLLPVDLGYNVEESLNGMAMYALAANDQKLTDLLVKSMQNHLEFMLPDGGWDNSWGTRQFKWTYWGSRTSDGCQPAYTLMRHKDPAFAAAAYQNTLLLKRCTNGGLLHGGPHYVSHGIKPCIHHTFTHAKALATVLDHEGSGFKMNHSAVLPRAKVKGVKVFQELDTSLASIGPWRATITAYDRMYTNNMFHPTGGTMSVLWHEKLGAVLSSSMAKYVMKEKYNMQPDPNNRDDPLSLRIETYQGDTWYTNLFDKKAKISHTANKRQIEFKIKTCLVSETGKSPKSGPVDFQLSYQLNDKVVIIRAKVSGQSEKIKISLVVPVISPSGEIINTVSNNKIEIHKPKGKITVQADCPLHIQDTGRQRIFNMVPGFEAVPFIAELTVDKGSKVIECKIADS